MTIERVHVGKMFGRLTVIERGEDKHYLKNGHDCRRKMWRCKCDCGNITTVREDALLDKSRPTASCGCLQKEAVKKYRKEHPVQARYGDSQERLHNIWYLMIQRCENPASPAYDNYGGRGIRVCPEWSRGDDGYFAFKKWALENGYRKHLSLDRICNDEWYTPNNCRWADTITQANNKRTNVLIEYNGRTQSLSQWAKELQIPMKTLHARLRSRGWSVERAFTQPLRKR